MIDAQRLEFREVVAVGAGLWRAPARAGDEIPTGRVFDARSSRPRIRINDGATLQQRQVDGFAAGCVEGDRYQTSSNQVPHSPIVMRRGDGRPIRSSNSVLHVQCSWFL